MYDLSLNNKKCYSFIKYKYAQIHCCCRHYHRWKNSQKLPLLTYCDPARQSLKKIITKNKYKKICVLGGTQIYSYCLEHDFIDELYLTIEPLTFGLGLSLFETKKTSQWRLKSSKQLNKHGSILLHYIKI